MNTHTNSKTIFFDCDSTLSSIEGVDELAALKGAETERQVVELTNQAMGGSIPIQEVFGRRLDLIQPSQEMCNQVGQKYIETISEGVIEALDLLSNDGWSVAIISGGFTQVIEPLADKLGIETIYAVDLRFEDNGQYKGFDESSPTARNGGKPEIIQKHKEKHSTSETVMVGDGVSDLETKSAVDLFVGYGGVVDREKVKEGSDIFLYSFSELYPAIKNYLPSC